jgi:hypothetical protein
MFNTIFFLITFVFGTLRLLLPIFKVHLTSFFGAVGIPTDNKHNTFLGGLMMMIDHWLFYFFIGYQVWFWLVKFAHLQI